MSEELKPCPFCQDGGTISIDNVDLSESWVWCEKCGAETSTYPSVSEAIAAWNQRAKPVANIEWVSCRRNETDPSVAHTLHTCFVGLVEVGEVLDYDEGDVWVDDGMRGGYCEFKDPAAPDIIAAAKASVAHRVHACLEGYDD